MSACSLVLALVQSVQFTGAHVLDEAGSAWLERTVVVADGKIEAVLEPSNAQSRSGDTREDCAGLWIVPGLIDLHVHLCLHPYDEMPWNDQVLKESLELRTIRAVVQAKTTLEAGFTTVRELGTEGAGFVDVALRDAIESGLIQGPRIFASTRAIVATGCYGPSGFDPRWDVPKGAQEADGVAGVRKVVREQVAQGADWIKVYADYRRANGDAATATFSLEELGALVDEAKSAGKPVAAHATTEEGIRRAVIVGVKTIEHGQGASRETLEMMKQKGIVLVPTLAASEALALQSGWKPGAPMPARLEQSKKAFALALEVGVEIACGSDAGVFAHGTNAREIELMVEYGMKPMQAIRAATAGAAHVLNRDAELGHIARGAKADFVMFASNPFEHVGVLRRPSAVVARGRIVVDRRK